MKTKYIATLAVGALLAVGCGHQPKEFTYTTFTGERIWQLDIDDSTTEYVHNSYEMQWPDKGVVPSSVERELLAAVFGGEGTGTLYRQCEDYLNSQGMLEEVEGIRYPCYQIDRLPDTVGCTVQELRTVCHADGRLATMTVTSYIFPLGAAHGSYNIMPIVVDLERGEVLHLTDIVDTSQLGSVVARAVNRLEANASVKGCLFDEFVGASSLPVSQVFSVNPTLDTLFMVYSLYWLAPYACGIQEVALPVTMLMENRTLTARGRELFATSNKGSF